MKKTIEAEGLFLTDFQKLLVKRGLGQVPNGFAAADPSYFFPMPNLAGFHWDDALMTHWDDGSFHDSAVDSPETLLIPTEPLALTSTLMEYWEITKARAQETLPVWTQYAPTLRIGTQEREDLTELIEGFEPLMQARTAGQETADAAYRATQDALLRMKVLGMRVPVIIEGQLDENEGIMRDVDDLYRNAPSAEGSILKRLRDLLPVWTRANAALAALTPAQPAITRTVGGTVYTVAAAQRLLDGYTNLVKTQKDNEELLDVTRTALRTHERQTDQLNKRWYKVAKASSDAGSDWYEALSGITTEL